MNKIENSIRLFKNGRNCAQAILETYASSANINSEIASKIGSGLGGGIGRKQHICGAVNAGAIIIGLKYGSGVIGDTESKEKITEIVGNYINECEKVLGNIQCKYMLNIDLSNLNERIAAKKDGLFERICDNAVKQSATILEKYLSH